MKSISNSLPYLGFSAVLMLWQTLGLAVEITQPQTTPLAASAPTALKPSIIDTETPMFDRQQWQLSEPEWQRYTALMQGIRGSVSPKSLSPLEVLGIHAETTQERKQYAKRWAKLMHEDVERTLAFQRAYLEAAKELYGQPPLFDAKLMSMGSPRNEAHAIADGDRLLVFVKLQDCLTCNTVVQQVLARSAGKRVQVDIYFTDTKEQQDEPHMVAWAKQHRLDPQQMAKKALTLNHDKGAYYQVSQKIVADVPVVYVLHGNQLHQWAN
ncbi:TIGR03759 family integrating conjugative element protein [Crenothrix polyspora]|uniref:Integrating conjugative element protein, PFL_4693 family n=1 Tax=Crenothrix polyspora TaxID=360316 RepID=A0A1R4H462_9GAMM|nr:TIGR03759 family integrating conjugative element protein [Crenothrix polyspora]SJM91024.1 Integrating conjugative element protein, PFL_4693 family [Crenothrix polyspora]